MLILKTFDFDKFIIVCDVLGIEIKNIIRNIMENYSYSDYDGYYKTKIINDAKDIIKLKINSDIGALNNNDFGNYYAFDNVKSLKDLNKIKEHVENKNKIYWISFSTEFNEKINDNTFFEGLTSLFFGKYFNHEIDGMLPKTLKFLRFDIYSSFDKSIDDLPKNLEELVLTGNFNQSINHLPINLKKLVLPMRFDRPINKLPDNLKYLELLTSFNQPIKKLPSKLTHLIFKNHSIYDHPLNNILPISLVHLKLGNNFNQPLDDLQKLTNLTHLEFGNNFNQSLDDLYKLTNLTHLKLGKNYKKPIKQWPINLIDLTIKSSHKILKELDALNNLPPNLESLDLGKKFNQYIEFWPPHLKELYFSNDSVFDQNIDNLPDSLNILSLNYRFDQKVNHWPSNLEKLYLPEKYNKAPDRIHNIEKSLPKSLSNSYIEYGHKIYGKQ